MATNNKPGKIFLDIISRLQFHVNIIKETKIAIILIKRSVFIAENSNGSELDHRLLTILVIKSYNKVTFSFGYNKN